MIWSRFTAGAALGAATTLLLNPGAAGAHGFAGARFFPATILNDDPFVADEASLPTLSGSPRDPNGVRDLGIDWEVSKRITPDLGISLGQGWKRLTAPGVPAISGLDAVKAGIAYQVFRDARHEAIALIGLNATFGHTGRLQVGAPDFTTLGPTLAFGKGFGDLPSPDEWLRPIAMTGNLALDLPTKRESAGSRNPNTFTYGFAFEYSLEYLQHQVKDIGLGAPFDRLIPLVEVSFTTALDRGQSGQTVGTVQPGFIWAGQSIQIGAEAIIPVTHFTGRGFGGALQVHFYLDDIFPGSVGRPIFGN